MFQCLAFTSLLISTLYFSIRRHSPIPTLFTSFDQVDWIRYSGRPVDRSNTVKKVRSKVIKQGTDTLPEEVEGNGDGNEELKAPSRTRFGGAGGGVRPDSQVPVLARSIHSTMGSISGGSVVGGNDSFSVDWDLSSERGGGGGNRDSTATTGPPRDQVFILITEKEEEEKDLPGQEQGEVNEKTGTAM